MEGPSTSAASDSILGPETDVQSCPNCFLSYGDFCVVYSGKIELLIEFSQRHGLILKEKLCPTCNAVCRLPPAYILLLLKVMCLFCLSIRHCVEYLVVLAYAIAPRDTKGGMGGGAPIY